MSTQKTVLITGTSSGIGKEIAKELNSKGWKVLATARRTESIKDLAELGITPLAVDVDSPESIANLKQEVEQITGGKLDMLINNAGRNYTVPALDIKFDEVEATFRTNVYSVMRMCQAFTPLLIPAKGTIVQIGSVAGIMPYVFGSVYNASKAALHAYSNTLRVELEPFDVRVITVVTGGVKSNIARTDRVLEPDSLYLPIEKEYIRRTKHSQEVGMETVKYARSVVSQLLKKKPSTQVWEGFGAKLVWFVSNFLPSWIFGIYMKREFNLWKVRKARDAKKTN